MLNLKTSFLTFGTEISRFPKVQSDGNTKSGHYCKIQAGRLLVALNFGGLRGRAEYLPYLRYQNLRGSFMTNHQI